jgi:hypothetical protein
MSPGYDPHSLHFCPHFLSVGSNLWNLWSWTTMAVCAAASPLLHVQQEGDEMVFPMIPGDCIIACHWLIPEIITMTKGM